ncbi:hypothetical protein TELCIR_15312 [Teladorsagia circumcincta]|uniref:Uncharacterized protein n=1 Tax=Teladorsagia circumcincta TaxID=45464 RepID=A0A2G9TYR3_TELCI|nr:hypothetical protein TELCIR_15312 [Teladorsagia circumcincta]
MLISSYSITLYVVHCNRGRRSNDYSFTSGTAENDGGGRIPSPDDFTFSNSSVTLKTALDLHSRTLELRKRREERARRLSVEAPSANEDDPDSSDTDPELCGIAAFEAAAKRDAELREQFKKEYESSHSEKSENSP